ncbi:MAG TPA: YidC/Oxa1 family membrane protein insertase, partial [Chloroflexota bacterium]|nr:YidC/Oxa1 family membrane protein insertase [Chloroflexota bacterium]
MSSNAPQRGPSGTLQRLLPFLVMGLTFLLLAQIFPQFFGMQAPAAAPTPSDSAVVAAVPTPVAAAVVDDSPKTQYWNMLLVHPLESGLRFFTNTLGLGAGTGIILFTVLVKLILLPLTIQQIRSQKAMQKLQPELKALQTKLKGDREKLGVETMALYKQHGVNPAAGCLPIVLQMPVLFGLYAALNNLGTQNIPENAAFQQPWLWVENLARPDILQLPFIGFPLP